MIYEWLRIEISFIHIDINDEERSVEFFIASYKFHPFRFKIPEFIQENKTSNKTIAYIKQ